MIGPGFLKADFILVGKSEAPEIFKGCVVENSGQGGMAGIHEAVSRGKLPNAVSQIKIQEEMAIIEDLREALAKEMATYGNEIEDAINRGAAESILMLSEKTRTDQGRKLLEIANNTRTEVYEISAHHHGGEMLAGLGDIAVILRYKLT